MNRIGNLLLLLVIVSFLACNSFSKKNGDASETEVPFVEKENVLHSDDSNAFDRSLFFKAALEGNLTTVEEGVNAGINVNAYDENKHTTLMLAAYNGHFHVISFLIKKGADIDAVDNMNRTALMFASTGPFSKAVKMLLDAGANPNATDSEESWTPVMMAAAEGQLEVIKILVDNGADLSMVDVDGESSFDFAKSKGHTEVAEYIKSHQ